MLTKVGALWLREGKKGKFMSGEVEVNGEKVSILVFKNNKGNSKHPDYQIMVASDDEPKEPSAKEWAGKDDDSVPF